jgi:hypothetical protein
MPAAMSTKLPFSSRYGVMGSETSAPNYLSPWES